MKIALVTDTFFPRINGVSTSTRTFADEFRRLGHEVHIFAPAYPQAKTESDVSRFPSLYLFFDPEDRLPVPFLGPKLARHFVEQRFDIVHTQTPFTLGRAALKWAQQSGSRVVHTYHTLFSAYIEHYLPWIPSRFAQSFTRSFSRNYCNRCDLIVCPSTEMRRVLSAYDVAPPIEVIPTGIQLARLEGHDRARFRRQLGFQPEHQVLLFMGRVAEEKNIDFLLRVVRRLKRRLPTVRFVIAGEGPAKPRLRRLCSQLELDDVTTFVGYLTKADWRDCYAAADLFVFGSVTETQGLVVTEAMAVGTPVVAVGEMGIKDVMASGRGGVTTRFDEAEFEAAVFRMLSDRDFYAARKAEARAEAERWSSSAMAARMIEAYASITEPRPLPFRAPAHA